MASQAAKIVPFHRPSHEFAHYDAPRNLGHTFTSAISPDELHQHLDIAPFVRMRFGSEKRLNAYRALLYKVNNQGKFRFATRREGWSNLIVLRLK